MEKSLKDFESRRRGEIDEDAVRYSPSLLFTPHNAAQMVDLIKKEMIASDRVWIASVFYYPGVINLFIPKFIRFMEEGGELKVLTSTMGNFNRPDYLVHLRDTVPGIQVRAYHPPEIPFDKTPPPFHPKAWLFRHRDGGGALLIGSSNFTGAGFLKNVEWNYFSAHEVNIRFEAQSPLEAALSEFTRYWDQESVEISDAFLAAYGERWLELEKGRGDVFDPPAEGWPQTTVTPAPVTAPSAMDAPEDEIVPNPAQGEALVNLSRMRGQGIKKASVIAATGVGKTHLAAFDYRESGFESMLFIAHRENILLKSRETFQGVLKDHFFGEILGAGQHAQNGSRAVFAMIQTLSRPEQLDRFSPEYFDYLVVDEFHHGMAPTYLKAIKHFKPRFLLCLTATPERMDGRDVLRLCDYNVAYEVRLLDAVDRGWLCPFQYFAVHDETDYRQIAWRGTHYDDEELTRALSSDTRTAIVAGNLRKYLPSFGKIKALAFCSSVSHAHYTAKRLTRDHGIASLALSGDNPGEERAAALARLEDENDPLQVICTVSIFNEGVDIPGLTHVLFLRPTQSFTVFLQQLGRGLRNSPGKDYLVVIDFVGNFKKAHVAPLALSGYTSMQEFAADRAAFMTDGPGVTLPKGCYLDSDLEVKRIWDREMRTILDGGIPIGERLKSLYNDIRGDLEGVSPSLTDFLDNAYHVDPYVFIRHFGNWLQAKLACEGDLDERERRLLGTPGEVFLDHLESGLNPVKSYKMVVLTCLLELAGNSWRVDDIAVGFRGYFLGHRERLFDYDDLAGSADPEHFLLSKVKAKLLQMPLKYLSNTDTDWFILDREAGTFALKPDMVPYWEDSLFRELVEDRVRFGLVRYFSRKGRVAEVPYDEALLKTGFSVRRDFACVFYSENPLKPGEERNLKIRINGDTYGVFFRRSENGKEYGIVYNPESRVVQALRQLLGKRFKRGETAFTLRASGKNELILALPQKGPDLRGILVEIPYAANTESGFTAQFRRILSEDPGGREWTLHFEKSGYTGAMEIEIENPGRFSAWTARRYDDPSRFPARIKAAATALFFEGYRGGFQVTAGPREVRIVRGNG
ncbi:MAG: DEAD/DEAH box helicase family protein [Deltaproteobacteria bacterium]|nr:DEAD/DEAH box helicase family protein [Deltaproteobacteria bacterium]